MTLGRTGRTEADRAAAGWSCFAVSCNLLARELRNFRWWRWPFDGLLVGSPGAGIQTRQRLRSPRSRRADVPGALTCVALVLLSL